MASAKRQLPNVVLHPKKPKADATSSSLPSAAAARVVLNPADCDLDFNIERNGLVGFGLHEEGFAYCWSGARANVGITRGRYCFGCKVVSVQPVNMQDTDLDQQHVCRLGISRGDDLVGNLGESKHSFGYGGTGKFSNAGRFSNYGERFGIGDTIVCCVDLESRPIASIGFSKNGKWLGTAYQFDANASGIGAGDSHPDDLLWKAALFPHVLLKNVEVQMQFSLEDGLVPEEGFKPWASAIEDKNMIMGPTFSDPRDCEVIMMVGLPASGKTTWAEKWVKDHPEKRYVLLGTNLIIDQMKIPGLLRKGNYGERFDRLMDQATKIFNVVLSRAASIPRNYIIDQTNVYKSARKRKLKPFADYQKIAAVVFAKPEELKIRADKRFKEMGKEVPPDALNDMIANYVLPKSKDMLHADEYFDRVIFVELNRDESQRYLDQMKQALASMSSNNSSSKLLHGGSLQSFAGPPLQNQGSYTGSGNQWQGSYSHTSLYNSGLPAGQVITNNHVTEGHRGSLNSFYGVYPSSQTPPVARELSPWGSYPNNETSVPGVSAGYRVIPTGDIGPYSNPAMGGHHGSHNIVSPCAFRGPYRSGMNETSPIANAGTMHFNYSGPHNDNRGFQPYMQTPSSTTYDSPSPFGTLTPRPPHGSLPDYMQPRPPPYGSSPDFMQNSQRHAAQRRRYF